MTTSLIATSALLLLLQAQPAPDAEEAAVEAQATETTAKEEARPEPAQEVEAADDDNRVICRRTQVIGSKFTKRICGTQAEWDELARKGQISTAEFQAKGAGIRQAGN